MSKVGREKRRACNAEPRYRRCVSRHEANPILALLVSRL